MASGTGSSMCCREGVSMWEALYVLRGSAKGIAGCERAAISSWQTHTKSASYQKTGARRRRTTTANTTSTTTITTAMTTMRINDAVINGPKHLQHQCRHNHHHQQVENKPKALQHSDDCPQPTVYVDILASKTEGHPCHRKLNPAIAAEPKCF